MFENNPHLGIITAQTGFIVTMLSWLGYVAPFIGIVGGAFGAMAGYYTWKIQRARWKRENELHNRKR